MRGDGKRHVPPPENHGDIRSYVLLPQLDEVNLF